jgi:hypothetical protein
VSELLKYRFYLAPGCDKPRRECAENLGIAIRHSRSGYLICGHRASVASYARNASPA